MVKVLPTSNVITLTTRLSLMLEIVLYVFVAVYALHLVAAFIIYMNVKGNEEKKAKALAAELLALKIQDEDNRIEALRKQRETEYYARIASERKAFAATTVMPLVPPPPRKT